MSSEEAEKSGKDEEKSTKKTKFSMQKIKNLKKLDQKEVFSYIENLHDFLKKHEKKLKKYKEKIKKLAKQVVQLKATQSLTKNDAVDVVAKVELEVEAKQELELDKENTPLSLVDEIRQAAEQAQNLNGFVYEPTSGLYYDQKTGYYYNAEYGLYYDGNTGCYYKYHQDKNEFEFHSQVPVTEAAASKATDNDTFDNYTVVADDNNEEWGVTTERPKNKKCSPTKNTITKSRKRIRKCQQSKPRRSRHSKHSESQSDSSGTEKTSSRKKCDKKLDADIKTDTKDMEDGELDSSGSNSYSDDDDGSSCYNSASEAAAEAVEIFNRGSHFQDIAKKYPPSLRIIVQESQLDAVKVGSLSLITFKGGSLGREGKHDVIIPDLNVSKFHLKFAYDTKKHTYKCVDLGSRNGTILNGTRMSTSKMESEPHDLVHGSVLQLGQTKLLCHVHEGNSTCGQCEPGLLIEGTHKELTTATTAVVLTHKEQLKKIQKKYGLENEKFVDGKQSGGNYNDRAATRRVKVGSSTDKEKTQIASVNTAISSENKGFKMLSKLGWSKGEALGKTTAGNGGLLEPINVSSNAGKKGLGCDESIPSAPVLSLAAKTKLSNLKKTQERYQKADIFQESSDDSS